MTFVTCVEVRLIKPYMAGKSSCMTRALESQEAQEAQIDTDCSPGQVHLRTTLNQDKLKDTSSES